MNSIGARGIPRKVEVFILRNIHAIEQLEILLLLHREPDREWSIDEVNDAIRTNPVSVGTKLADLCARKLLGKKWVENRWVYRYAAQLDISKEIDELDKFYGTHRHVIIELIYSRPAETIRIFADAFRFRQDDD